MVPGHLHRLDAAPAWARPLLRKPFERGANGPRRFDCWGLTRAALLAGFGVELPELDALRGLDWTEQLELAASDTWTDVPIGTERAGDVLAFEGAQHGLHVAVVCWPSTMLTTDPRRGAHLDTYTRPVWRDRLVCASRHPMLVRPCPRT